MTLIRNFIFEADDDTVSDKKSNTAIKKPSDKEDLDASLDDIDFDMGENGSEDKNEDKKGDNFDELVYNINGIKFARNFAYDINNVNLETYISEFIGQTKNKSLLLGIMDDEILANNIIKIINSSIQNFENSKVVLIFSDVISIKDILNNDNNIQFVIGNYLKSIIKNLTFDTWFDADQSIIDDVIKRTNCSKDEVMAAIYCILKIRQSDKLLLDTFGIPSVIELLKYYGVNETSVKSISSFIFPEDVGHLQNVISYIVKVFNHVLKVELLNKVIQYEKNGFKCIVLCNMNIAYELKNTFKNLYKKYISSEKSKLPKDHKSSDKGKKISPTDSSKKRKMPKK